MIKYPMFFSSQSVSPSGIQAAWTSKAASQDQELRMAIPPEFEGPGGGSAPRIAQKKPEFYLRHI